MVTYATMSDVGRGRPPVVNDGSSFCGCSVRFPAMGGFVPRYPLQKQAAVPAIVLHQINFIRSFFIRLCVPSLRACSARA